MSDGWIRFAKDTGRIFAIRSHGIKHWNIALDSDLTANWAKCHSMIWVGTIVGENVILTSCDEFPLEYNNPNLPDLPEFGWFYLDELPADLDPREKRIVKSKWFINAIDQMGKAVDTEQ